MPPITVTIEFEVTHLIRDEQLRAAVNTMDDNLAGFQEYKLTKAVLTRTHCSPRSFMEL